MMNLRFAFWISAALLCPAAEGPWEPLFDGRSTAAWREVTGAAFPASSWIVEDGCLKPVPGEGGRQDIRTAAEYRDFELIWEWRAAPGANSGLKYFIRKVDRWDARSGGGYHARGRGAEYQIADDAGDRDALRDPARSSGSLYSRMAPQGKRLKPVGEFNESRIVVRGGHAEHWLNGVKVLEYDEPDPPAGPIVLQNHNSVVWFRNVRIRRLD